MINSNTTTSHTFSFDFTRFETVAQMIGTLEDVVTKIYFTVWAEDSSGNRLPYYGDVILPAPSGGTFVPYEDLKPEIIQEWVETALGEDEIVRITDQLTLQLAQDDVVVVNRVPPWHQ
jgi:hypothetical protein